MPPPCAFLLGALLAVVCSAQFPRLPKIDPGQLAGVVKKAEKEVKQTLSQTQSQDLVKDLQGKADGVAQSAAQAAKTIAGDAQAQLQAAKTIAGNAQAPELLGATGGQPTLATTAPAAPAAPAPVVSEGSHAIVHTDELIKTLRGQGNPSNLTQVLKDVHKIVKANKEQVEDLASKVVPGINPSKVMSGVNKVVGKVLKSDPKNVAHAAEKGVDELNKIVKVTPPHFLNGDKGEEGEESEQASDVEEEDVGYMGSNWYWSLILIVGAVGALVFGWQVMKRRDSRTPTLLADNDMAGWMGGGPTSSTSRQMQSEEQFFRQF